ncbi:MAG: hypothetical protein M0038_11425 [Pseudomonadota bacterium]|jgi:hypothetical protein|nr:hypothetical protein [Pseudomonadota bacterium]
MNTRDQSIRAWRDVHARLGRTGGTVTIPKTTFFPHPRDAGARQTTTWAVGQLADYLLDLELGSAPLIVREFADYYEAFMTGVQLGDAVLNLANTHPRAARYLGGAMIGALVGTAIARKSEGALVGAGLGVLLAALVEAMHADTRDPSASAF